MKIDNRIVNYEINKNLPNAASDVANEKNLPKEQHDVEGKGSRDTIVNLSQKSKEVQLAEKVIAAEPDVREDRVAALKASVESASYEVDQDLVADKMVDNAMEEIFR